MSTPLPDGFVVRLHHDVVVGPVVTRGARVLRLSSAGRDLLDGRDLEVTSPTTAALAGRLLDLDLAVPVLDEVGSGSPADLTIVVPVRDRPDGVDRLLAELAPVVRCIVVDDASRDADALARAVRPHGAALVRLDDNMGPAAARNRGLRDVSTPFVAFIDSDVQVAASDLLRLLAHFADPALAAVAPRVRSRGGRLWFEQYEDAAGSLDLGSTSATVRAWSPVAYVPSACLLARVDAIGAGFDEELRSGEDVDLVWRLLDDGRRVRHASEVDAWHDGRTLVRTWLGRKAFYGSSAASLARRHGERVAPAVLTWSSAGLIGSFLAPRRLLAPAVGLAVARQWRAVSADLPGIDARTRARVAAAGATVTARQATDLTLRHWWPVSLVAATASRRVRGIVAVMAVADGLLARSRAETRLDPVRFVAARRADDLAYGAGVWWAAWRDRSVRSLLPRWLPTRRQARP
ncbi:mycofactocin biosynthesis glycosyltransferase MftF [Aeromicrobium stalagmiti]|uniref:mycofactocin biosynthesis glycosyltransferase MftF n=1 Tax=Aeromicrobium stalagmiti TaxID=2738988 RepID=UPI0015685B71|nr:mycofactocin biosynthesis glycosyltransferase MftF [Aeromicrobium stalagmiti]